MAKIKCELCEGYDNVVKFLNELKEKGHNLSMNLLSITQNGMHYKVFYNDVFDGRKNNGNL